MFIDERGVDRLFGAIVQPEYILLQSSETSQHSQTSAQANDLEGSGEVSIPAFFKLGTKAKLSHSAADAMSRTAQITKQFVYSSEQRLQDIVVAYKESFPDRVLFEAADRQSLTTLKGESLDWTRAESMLDTSGPRPIVFIDLPPGVPILPMAAEATDGKTILLFEQMTAAIEKSAQRELPKFPRDSDIDAAAGKDRYWNALIEAYDNRIALETVENAFQHGSRIEWIDYRIRLPTRAKPVHVHLAPSGRFPTGAFAFNFVRRGFKVGIRIVAQLRKGCDINVLALYER